MTSTIQETETATASTAAEPKAAKKATGAKRAGHVAPKKAKSGRRGYFRSQ